jgi:Ca-activated chloride channel family protein
VPKSAALSEVEIVVGERTLRGEVVRRKEARTVYEDEKAQGNSAGLTEKNGFLDYRFHIANMAPNTDIQIKAVWYQALEVESGIARYLYPLEDGGTDEAANSFWTRNEVVTGNFSADIVIKSAAPVLDLRLPGWDSIAKIEQLGEGHRTVHLEATGESLDRDLLLYYRLADDLPGRIDLVAHRPDPTKPGHFMMVVTPGVDLKPIENGSDYVFVLDISGSMQGKLATLQDAVVRSLQGMAPDDRFKVVVFSETARELNNTFWNATPERIATMANQVDALVVEGGTNLYAGLDLGLGGLDDDRVTSVLLVTDAVTNQGLVDPKEFADLLSSVDVRVFGFLLGNSGNWPLMRVIADASGGFSQGVSTADDIMGQLLLAKEKITHEAMHDAELTVRGVKVMDVGDEHIGKVYRGRQLVVFGKYAKGGRAKVTLKAKISGEDKEYVTEFDFPDIATHAPEVERLFALARIEDIEDKINFGIVDASESEDAIADLGVAYQLVTDQTSMLVLDDDAFKRHKITRRNRKRVSTERAAQAARAPLPPTQTRVDTAQPAFPSKAPRLKPGRTSKRRSGGGGGAIDPITLGIGGSMAFLAIASRRRREQEAALSELKQDLHEEETSGGAA